MFFAYLILSPKSKTFQLVFRRNLTNSYLKEFFFLVYMYKPRVRFTSKLKLMNTIFSAWFVRREREAQKQCKYINSELW